MHRLLHDESLALRLRCFARTAVCGFRARAILATTIADLDPIGRTLTIDGRAFEPFEEDFALLERLSASVLRGHSPEETRDHFLFGNGSQETPPRRSHSRSLFSRMVTYRISPTDLVYLWNQCRFCFTDVVKNGLQLPRSFSPHFTSADRSVRKALADLEIVDCGVGPRFRIIAQGLWVESQPIPFPEHGLSLSFFGQLDALVVTEHDEVFVVDYKTTTLDDTALSKLRRQLSCYVTAIERPKAASHLLPKYVDGMALLIFDPATFALNPKTKNCGLYGRTRWLELPRRDDLFDAFLTTVAAILAAPEPPQPWLRAESVASDSPRTVLRLQDRAKRKRCRYPFG